jgi:hypothetical protein
MEFSVLPSRRNKKIHVTHETWPATRKWPFASDTLSVPFSESHFPVVSNPPGNVAVAAVPALQAAWLMCSGKVLELADLMDSYGRIKQKTKHFWRSAGLTQMNPNVAGPKGPIST